MQGKTVGGVIVAKSYLCLFFFSKVQSLIFQLAMSLAALRLVSVPPPPSIHSSSFSLFSFLLLPPLGW